MKKLLIAALTVILIAGCTTFQNVGSNDLLVQYSTLKLIEQSDDVTSQGVIDAVEKARGVLDATEVEVSFAKLKERVAQEIEFSEMAPSDRLLIQAVVNEVEADYVKTYQTDVLSEEVKVTISQFLDLVEQAARLSQ